MKQVKYFLFIVIATLATSLFVGNAQAATATVHSPTPLAAPRPGQLVWLAAPGFRTHAGAASGRQ